jgi:hypothetical protein
VQGQTGLHSKTLWKQNKKKTPVNEIKDRLDIGEEKISGPEDEGLVISKMEEQRKKNPRLREWLKW